MSNEISGKFALTCMHSQSMDVDEESDKIFDYIDPPVKSALTFREGNKYRFFFIS